MLAFKLLEVFGNAAFGTGVVAILRKPRSSMFVWSGGGLWATMDGLIQKVVSPDLRGTETLIQTSNSTDLHRPVTACARSLCTLSRPKDSPRGVHESSNKCNEFLGLERALPGVAGASPRSRAGMSVLNHLPASATRKCRLLVAKSEILRTHLGSRKQRSKTTRKRSLTRMGVVMSSEDWSLF